MTRTIALLFSNFSLKDCYAFKRLLCSRQRVRKSHGKKSQYLITFVFCTENDNSEQTLESYKSKSNEESPGHEKNEQGKKLQPI